MESPFNGTSQAKIVDPSILLTAQDRKYKSHLTAFQAAVFSKINALNAFFTDNDTNVLEAFVRESEEYSGSIITGSGITGPAISRNVDGYVKVANTRVYVADKKRTTTLETENTV